MRGIKVLQHVAVALAVVGFCVPQVAFATTPQAQTASVISDVRLHESGALLGRLVSPEDTPVPGAMVSLESGGKQLAQAKTDKSGYFAFTNLTAGVYRLVSPKGRTACRVWTPQTAPPSAQLGALVVDGDATLVRGQHGFGGCRKLLTNPWFVAAVIAAAVAIPVAIHNSKGPSSP